MAEKKGRRLTEALDMDDQVVEARVAGQQILVDKRDDHLIINNECKRIMRNLCSVQTSRGSFCNGEGSGVTQPSFLSTEDRVLFFKTKMFYLLQERLCFLQPGASDRPEAGTCAKQQVVPADAYAPFLSPFCDSALDVEEPDGRKKRHTRSQKLLSRVMPDGPGLMASTVATMYASRSKSIAAMNPIKIGLFNFLDHIRKADQSTMRMLEEKILKTLEGAGYANLLGDKDVKKADVILRLFPDYNRLLKDGKDEESKLNNLVNHVRTRIKYFDKMQSFYENQHDDHTVHTFTVPNLDHVDVREELIALRPKRLHHVDDKVVQRLYAIFKDDYGAAKTTLVADGTQPVVLNRKKLDRVKKYVDDCAEWKGNLLVPYNRETNFFFLMFPWSRQDVPRKTESSEGATGGQSSFQA